MSKKAFTAFNLRWREPLGRPECPFVVRWVLTVAGYSLRLHHWLGSDDQRFYHDHAWDFVSVIIKGSYMEVTPDPNGSYRLRVCYPWDVRHYRAEHQHMVKLDRGPCWSVVFSWPKRRNFGYYVKGTLLRPLRYFSRYGLHPCE